MPSLVSQKLEDVLVVYFKDARILDEATIQPIGRELMDLATRCEDGKLLLNFEEVKFMSSAMINNIVNFHRKCAKADIKLKLCDISPKILEVFTITRLDKVLEIHADEEAALEAFGGKRSWFGR